MKFEPFNAMNNPNRSDITPRECAAIRLLSDEWTTGELRMCFAIGENAVRRHACGECSCDPVRTDP